MRASSMSNIAITGLSTTWLAITFFKWAWDSIHYVPLMWPYHLQWLREIRHMSSLKHTRKISLLSTFNTSSNRSMTYWTNPMLSTSSSMINIRCHTSSRWVTIFGYICRRSDSLGLTARFIRFNIGHTPSPMLWEITILTSAFPHSLACTQCSMWITFNHTFHHYSTHSTFQNNSHQQS